MKLYNEFAYYVDLEYGVSKDYQKEVDFILKILKKHKITSGLVYDVACGSGRHSQGLLKKGFRVEGVDLNQGMVNLAKKRLPKFKIHKQDMRNLDLPKQADCILTMFNAINHLESYKDFERMLCSYKKHLAPSGIIIFDTRFDQRNFIENFHKAEITQIGDVLIGKINRSKRLNKTKAIVNQVFSVFEKNAKRPKITEIFYEALIFEVPKMQKIIKKLGFKCKIYYNFSLTAKYTRNCYYVFVLQKL